MPDRDDQVEPSTWLPGTKPEPEPAGGTPTTPPQKATVRDWVILGGVVLVLLMIIGSVMSAFGAGDSGDRSATAANRDSEAAGPAATSAAKQPHVGVSGSDAATATSAPAPSVRFSVTRSFCAQMPLTDGNVVEQLTEGTLVKFVVYLRNSGGAPATDGTIAPTRVYANGDEAFSPFKDTMTDIDVPNDGRWHPYWHSYKVGPGKTIADCRARLDIDGLTGSAERSLRVTS